MISRYQFPVVLLFCFLCNFTRTATKTPSKAPTTKAPSNVPTVKPSTFPSKVPSKNPTKAPTISTKKGFAYPDSLVSLVKPSWYYNWKTVPTAGVVGVPFVPMVWGRNSVPPTNVNIILGFNEPDSTSQSNILPIDAANLWYKVINTGATQIGSPATAENPSTGTWLKTFLNSTITGTTSKPKVDFICVHRYAGPDAVNFLNFVDNVWNTFKKPIWITEFAVADWSATTAKSTKYDATMVLNFTKTVLPALESRSYVQRYSWKTRTTTDNNMWFSAIFYPNSTLTPLGKYYSQF